MMTMESAVQAIAAAMLAQTLAEVVPMTTVATAPKTPTAPLVTVMLAPTPANQRVLLNTPLPTRLVAIAKVALIALLAYVLLELVKVAVEPTHLLKGVSVVRTLIAPVATAPLLLASVRVHALLPALLAIMQLDATVSKTLTVPQDLVTRPTLSANLAALDLLV